MPRNFLIDMAALAWAINDHKPRWQQDGSIIFDIALNLKEMLYLLLVTDYYIKLQSWSQLPLSAEKSLFCISEMSPEER
jgi:hypothetical protein